jgi:hypothetical protein
VIDYREELRRIEETLDSLRTELDETDSQQRRLTLAAEIDALEKDADLYRSVISLEEQ